MNEAKNRACPFCNDRVIKAQAIMLKNYPAGYNAMCDNCESTGPYAETPEGALEKWNNRAGGSEPEAAPNAGDIAGSVSANGWNALVERLQRRRDYWLTSKDDAMRVGNLCNAGGFDCRAAGLQDAITISKALEKEQHSNAALSGTKENHEQS